MKTHFGFFENFGDYEYSLYGCESTICGHQGENVTEKHTVEDWDFVTCKNCLKLKDKVIEYHKIVEEVIVNQMADMADFFSNKELNDKANKMTEGAKQ